MGRGTKASGENIDTGNHSQHAQSGNLDLYSVAVAGRGSKRSSSRPLARASKRYAPETGTEQSRNNDYDLQNNQPLWTRSEQDMAGRLLHHLWELHENNVEGDTFSGPVVEGSYQREDATMVITSAEYRGLAVAQQDVNLGRGETVRQNRQRSRRDDGGHPGHVLNVPEASIETPEKRKRLTRSSTSSSVRRNKHHETGIAIDPTGRSEAGMTGNASKVEIYGYGRKSFLPSSFAALNVENPDQFAEISEHQSFANEIQETTPASQPLLPGPRPMTQKASLITITVPGKPEPNTVLIRTEDHAVSLTHLFEVAGYHQGQRAAFVRKHDLKPEPVKKGSHGCRWVPLGTALWICQEIPELEEVLLSLRGVQSKQADAYRDPLSSPPQPVSTRTEDQNQTSEVSELPI